jgi:hypothetical protein
LSQKFKANLSDVVRLCLSKEGKEGEYEEGREAGRKEGREGERKGGRVGLILTIAPSSTM